MVLDADFIRTLLITFLVFAPLFGFLFGLGFCIVYFLFKRFFK